MRPTYETPQHLSREEEFSRLVSQKFKCTFMKMPIRYGLDFCAMRDGIAVGFMEVKVRSNKAGKYDTYMLSLGKIMAANDLLRSTSLPSVLAVRWLDAWGHVYISGDACGQVSFGGRSDRDDEQDMEPVVLIPMSRFKITPLPA